MWWLNGWCSRCRRLQNWSRSWKISLWQCGKYYKSWTTTTIDITNVKIKGWLVDIVMNKLNMWLTTWPKSILYLLYFSLSLTDLISRVDGNRSLVTSHDSWCCGDCAPINSFTVLILSTNQIATHIALDSISSTLYIWTIPSFELVNTSWS